MNKPKTVKEYRRHFYKQGIDPLMIRDLYGDLRLRSTWEQAYNDMVECNELPTIKAIVKSSQNVDQPENFVPPAPPTLPPAPPITQPLLPPAKEYQLLPPAREPQEQPGDGRRDNLELQRLPYFHSQLLIAAIAAPIIFPDLPLVSDEPVVILDESAREVAPKIWSNKECCVKHQHICLLGNFILLFGIPKYRSPGNRILGTARPPPFKTMNERTRRKIIVYLAKQPPIELSFSPLELFVILEILLQTLAVTKIFERQIHFFRIKLIANLNLRYPKIAKVIRDHWMSTINSQGN